MTWIRCLFVYSFIRSVVTSYDNTPALRGVFGKSEFLYLKSWVCPDVSIRSETQ